MHVIGQLKESWSRKKNVQQRYFESRTPFQAIPLFLRLLQNEMISTESYKKTACSVCLPKENFSDTLS